MFFLFEKQNRTLFLNIEESRVNQEDLELIVNELINDGNSHYETTIGRATYYEIISTILVFVGTVLTFWLIKLTTSDGKL